MWTPWEGDEGREGGEKKRETRREGRSGKWSLAELWYSIHSLRARQRASKSTAILIEVGFITKTLTLTYCLCLSFICRYLHYIALCCAFSCKVKWNTLLLSSLIYWNRLFVGDILQSKNKYLAAIKTVLYILVMEIWHLDNSSCNVCALKGI